VGIHKEIRLAILVLLGLQALTAVGGIVLLGRLGPAVEMVLAENDYSVQASEDAEAILVEMRGMNRSPDPRQVAVLRDALDRMVRNVTEPQEPPVIRGLEEDLSGVLAGNELAVQRFHVGLRTLGGINRAAMHAVNQRAGRLTRAGAWTMVVLALATLTAGLFAMGRARRRIIEPLDRVVVVAQAWRRGDRLRRSGVGPHPAAPGELSTVGSVLDELLDLAAGPRTIASGPSEALRIALNGLLETRPGPAAVVDVDGCLVAANLAALDQLGDLGRILQGEGTATLTDLGEGVRLVEAWQSTEEKPEKPS